MMESSNNNNNNNNKEEEKEKEKKVVPPLVECVQRRDTGGLRQLLRQLLSCKAAGAVQVQVQVQVDEVDEHGMTALQHAAFKGQREMAALLLDHGASVNHSQHEHAYTALMFACLSGNAALTADLLAAGANTTALNSVGRTAAQMAAFVGNHACVSMINTFISKEVVDYYTVPQGLETEPKLPPHLSNVVHRLVTRVNIHPVGMLLFVTRNAPLLEELPKAIRVVELLSEREMKSPETNEILALKLHLVASVLKALQKTLSRSGDADDAEKKNVKPSDEMIKSWIRGRSADGFPENLERFLRQCVREFRFTDSSILQQLVRNLAPVAVGDEPSAITLLSTTINGQRAVVTEEACATCGEGGVSKKCSVCKSARYCDQRCQKLHWFVHKKFCSKLAEENAERSKEDKENRAESSELAKSEGKEQE